ncbi:MAG: DUF2306 domain-containing protein [Pseudomonadota bacterium]
MAIEPQRADNGPDINDTMAGKVLQKSGLLWYLVAFAGQAAFVFFILAYYGVRTATGNFEGWNEKPIIMGYVEGDRLGNVMFALHVLGAAVITTGGLIQLIPKLRASMPWLHRWNGRIFIVLAYSMALGGIVLVWGRGTYLSVISGFPTTLNGVLIIIFASAAWRLAMARDFDAHRRWAMRTFMVVNGVWFFRIGIMAYSILVPGRPGTTRSLDGPADLALSYGSFLIPLLVLELYFAAQESQSARRRLLTSGLVLAMTMITAVGVFGTVMFMWRPYI